MVMNDGIMMVIPSGKQPQKTMEKSTINGKIKERFVLFLIIAMYKKFPVGSMDLSGL